MPAGRDDTYKAAFDRAQARFWLKGVYRGSATFACKHICGGIPDRSIYAPFPR